MASCCEPESFQSRPRSDLVASLSPDTFSTKPTSKDRFPIENTAHYSTTLSFVSHDRVLPLLNCLQAKTTESVSSCSPSSRKRPSPLRRSRSGIRKNMNYHQRSPQIPSFVNAYYLDSKKENIAEMAVSQAPAVTPDPAYYSPVLTESAVSRQQRSGGFQSPGYEQLGYAEQENSYPTTSTGLGHFPSVVRRSESSTSLTQAYHTGEIEGGMYNQQDSIKLEHPIKLDSSHDMAGDSWVYQISQHPMHPYEGQSSGILPTHSVPLNTNVAHLPLSDPNSAPSDNSSSRGHSPGAFTYPPSSTHNIYRSNDLPPSRSSSFQEVDLASEHRLPNNSSYNIGPRVTVGSSLPVEQTNYVESRSTGVQLLQCTQCTQRFATHEHFIKHQTKHQKLHRCRVQGCSRIEGFTTPNDRDRHEKSVHKTPGMYFRCMDETCTSFMKTFARRDNLKDHLKRMHKMPPEMDEAEANERRNELADRWRVDLTPALTPPPGL